MKLRKISIILLALLLAAMAMVPMVSAVDTNLANVIQANENMKIAAPDNNYNLIDELGLQKAQIHENKIPLKTYTNSKDVADKIMKKAKISDSEKSIIGLYDFGPTQILLIKRGDSVLEVVDNGNSVSTQTINPQFLGEKKYSRTPRIVNANGEKPEKLTVTTEIVDRMSSFSIESPDASRSPMTTTVMTRSRTDSYVGTQTWATCTAKGTFYINVGSSVSTITDESSYHTTWPYGYCEFRSSTSGQGSQAGKVNAHLKGGLTYFRLQIDNWVGMAADLTPSDGGSAITWMAATPDGCI